MEAWSAESTTLIYIRPKKGFRINVYYRMGNWTACKTTLSHGPILLHPFYASALFLCPLKISPAKTSKPLVLCFQGVSKENNSIKCVKPSHIKANSKFGTKFIFKLCKCQFNTKGADGITGVRLTN